LVSKILNKIILFNSELTFNFVNNLLTHFVPYIDFTMLLNPGGQPRPWVGSPSAAMGAALRSMELDMDTALSCQGRSDRGPDLQAMIDYKIKSASAGEDPISLSFLLPPPSHRSLRIVHIYLASTSTAIKLATQLSL